MPVLYIFLILLPGLAEAAGEITVSPSGYSDQNVINDALTSVYQAGGGTVYLNPGVYTVDGPVIIHSNTVLTGSPAAIIRVSASSSQWFTDSTGLISSYGPVDNVLIDGIQLDGNCQNLPESYSHSRPDTAHDCERAILLRGYSNQFSNNITIKNMKIYNCFSDGINIAFANNVLITDSVFSNCEHEGVFFIAVRNGLMQRINVAAIVSDAIRFDNCEFSKALYSTFFSYNGDDSNDEWQGGANGVQISDEGYSHGGGSDLSGLIHTNNIEVAYCTFANVGLRDFRLDSSGKGLGDNIYIHDNKQIGKAQLETSGVSFDIDSNNPVTLERSEKVFGSIFDILKAPLSDSGYLKQPDIFSPNESWVSDGTTSAWIDVPGYMGQIQIGNSTCIPKPANESALVRSGIKSTRDRVISQESSKKLSVGADNNLTVQLEVKTTYQVPISNHITILGKTLNYTSYRDESENTTFTKIFHAPELFPAFQAPNVSVTYYNNSHAIVAVPDIPGIVKIDYSYNNSSCSEYRLIGYVGSATNGFKSTDYEVTENYIFDNSGEMSRSLDGLYIKGDFDISKLKVTVITPYDTFHISHFDYSEIEDDHMKLFQWSSLGILGFFVIYGRAIHKIIFMVIGKWI